MDILFEIEKIKPEGSQLLIRTDLKYNNWFIHFFHKEYTDENGWCKAETIFKGYYSNDEIQDVLKEILMSCKKNNFKLLN